MKVHRHTKPTPVSRAREATEKAQRRDEARRPALARFLTPEELRHVQELSRAGLVVRLPDVPPTGLDCACDGQVQCLAHATAKPEPVKTKAIPWLPPKA